MYCLIRAFRTKCLRHRAQQQRCRMCVQKTTYTTVGPAPTTSISSACFGMSERHPLSSAADALITRAPAAQSRRTSFAHLLPIGADQGPSTASATTTYTEQTTDAPGKTIAQQKRPSTTLGRSKTANKPRTIPEKQLAPDVVNRSPSPVVRQSPTASTGSTGLCLAQFCAHASQLLNTEAPHSTTAHKRPSTLVTQHSNEPQTPKTTRTPVKQQTASTNVTEAAELHIEIPDYGPLIARVHADGYTMTPENFHIYSHLRGQMNEHKH